MEVMALVIGVVGCISAVFSAVGVVFGVFHSIRNGQKLAAVQIMLDGRIDDLAAAAARSQAVVEEMARLLAAAPPVAPEVIARVAPAPPPAGSES